MAKEQKINSSDFVEVDKETDQPSQSYSSDQSEDQAFVDVKSFNNIVRSLKDLKNKVSDSLSESDRMKKQIKNNTTLLTVGFLVLLVMVATLLAMSVFYYIDTVRLNSVTYYEYSRKIDSLEELKTQNAYLIKQNSLMQEEAIQQQATIIELLKN